jgi:hypothetical protein
MRDILTHLAKQCKIKIATNSTAYIPTLKGGALRRCLVNPIPLGKHYWFNSSRAHQ